MKSSWQNKVIKTALRVWGRLGSSYSIRERRANMEWMTAHPLPDGMLIDYFTIGRTPAAWIYEERGPTRPILLWFHGGAFVSGSINTHRSAIAELAKRAGCRALLVDYRLAPEYSFPGAHDDCLECYRWLIEQGYKGEEIVLGGDSAGANIAMGTLLALRDAGEPLPLTAVLLSGGYMPDRSGETIYTHRDKDPFINDQTLEVGRYYYSHDQIFDTRLSPGFGKLAGLPPLYLTVGTEERLLSDSLSLAERAREAGVDVQLEVGEDMVHVYPLFYRWIPEADKSLGRIADYIRSLTLAQPPSSNQSPDRVESKDEGPGELSESVTEDASVLNNGIDHEELNR